MIRGTYYGLRIKNVHWRLCTISTVYVYGVGPKTQLLVK